MNKVVSLFLIVKVLSLAALHAQVDSASVADEKLRYPPDIYIERNNEEGEAIDYLRVDFFQEDFFYVVKSIKDSSIVGSSAFPAPPQFIHKIKIDSVNRDYNQYPYWMDSTTIVDYAGVDSFYKYNDSIHVDTIWISHADRYHEGDLNSSEISGYCQYVNNMKHGNECRFYPITDLLNLTVNGKNFHLKEKGHWKKGHKTGKWFYYNPNGELSRIEKWRNGKLIRTRYPD